MLKVLGIESSCDESAAAIISETGEIIADYIYSQHHAHGPYQGVVPEIASRLHLNNTELAIKNCLTRSNLKLSEIDIIAATSGPGLIGGVIVGCMFGKTLASQFKKPFIAVNHLEGHVLTARFTNKISYPYLLLLVSGGHCQFISVKGLANYQILGQTVDDAVGEAFDKVAKILALPFPGGPSIEKQAIFGNPRRFIFPKPMFKSNDCNLSFSGLKTAVRLKVEELKQNNQGILLANDINDVAASFQYTVGELLGEKILKAIEKYELTCSNSKIVVLAGGVAANQYLIKIIRARISPFGYELAVPPLHYCTDNAVMIAYAGLERYKSGLMNSLNFCPRSRWGLDELTKKINE